MSELLLPPKADNTVRGSRIALWILVVVLLVKLAMSFNCIFNGRKVAMNADGLPLETFTAGGAQAVVGLFAMWGMAQLVLCLLGLLVLARYRALVPLMFSLWLVDHLGRKAIHSFLPIVAATSIGHFVNLGLIALIAVGLALSLWGGRRPAR